MLDLLPYARNVPVRLGIVLKLPQRSKPHRPRRMQGVVLDGV
jgi:hypothetical protein